MGVEIVFYQPEHLSALSYDLGEQLKNTASPEIALKRIGEGLLPAAVPCTIVKDGFSTGFFLLDFGDDKDEISTNKYSVLLRSLSVNPSLQGHGAGREALVKLPEFIKSNFPYIDEIVLAVNKKNLRAKNSMKILGTACCQKSGWEIAVCSF